MFRPITTLKRQDDISEPMYCNFSIHHISEYLDSYSHANSNTFTAFFQSFSLVSLPISTFKSGLISFTDWFKQYCNSLYTYNF